MEREQKFARLEEARERRARIYNKAAQEEMDQDGVVWLIGRFNPSGQKHYQAQRVICDLGFSVYLPLGTRYQKLTRYRKSRERKAYPEMPGCLFIGFPGGPNHYPYFFSSQSIVRNFVGMNGKAFAFKGEQLAGFFNQTAFTPVENKTEPDFVVGDEVLILEGGLEGRVVEVTELRKNDTTVVASIFGRPTAARIGLDKLSKVL